MSKDDFRDYMYKNNFKYYFYQNKSKILLLGSIVFTIGVVSIGMFLMKKNNNYQSFDGLSSKKYVLADHVMGANKDGKVNLYSSKNGKVTDSINLDGNFIIDSSDDLSEAYMLDVNKKDLFILKTKGNKIDKEKIQLNINTKEELDSFDYDNGSISILCKDKKTFLVGTEKSKTLEPFIPFADDDINLFRITGDNLVFTAGEYIYSKSLKSNATSSENIKVSQTNLKVRDKENIEGTIIGEISAGEKVKILGEARTGWYIIDFKGKKGYVSNASDNFKDPTTEDGGLIKIHIGEESNFIHEFKNKVFIDNGFGNNRGKSILIEVNPDSLYIKNLLEYKEPTKTLISNSEDNRIYISEISRVENGEYMQIVKYKKLEDSDDKLGFKHESETILDNSNSYGSLGYVYHKNNSNIEIFNLKSREKDLTIASKDDFFMPIY